MRKTISHQPPASFTTTQVANMLGIKTSTVHAWLSRKEMHSLKIGNRRYIMLQHIQEFQEKRETGEYIDYRYTNGPTKSGNSHV